MASLFNLGMESVPKITIFDLKVMVKSGIDFFEIFPWGKMVIFVTKFVICIKLLL